MAVSNTGSRKIVVENTEFRWSITGNDGWITVVIWPVNKDVVKLIGVFDYHQEFSKDPERIGLYNLSKGQIIITTRVIRKIIDHVGVNEILNMERPLNLGRLYDINDALRVPVKESEEGV